MAVILAVMLVISSLAAFVAYESVQRNRLGYIGIEVDKEVFTSEEDVTFRLVSLSRNAEFNITDRWNDDVDDDFYRGLDLVRVPDIMDAETFLDDLSSLDYLRNHNTYVPLGRAFFDHFDSQDDSLQVTWNGTVVKEYWDGNGSFLRYSPAVSGFYVIVPRNSWSADHKVSFLVNERSVFYYDSLDVGMKVTNHIEEDVTVELTLRAPPWTIDNVTCDLDLVLYYQGSIFEPAEDEDAHHYEEKSIVLNPGQDRVRTLVFNVSIPDHGYAPPGTEGLHNRYFSTLTIDVVLTTTIGTYVTGLSAIWDGGWDYQYQY